MIRDNRPHCDICGLRAPDAATVMKGHGLRRLGWHINNRGAHVCPAHPHPEKTT